MHPSDPQPRRPRSPTHAARLRGNDSAGTSIRPPPEPPATHELPTPGRLLLWALRHWVRGQHFRQPVPGYVFAAVDELDPEGVIGDALRRLLVALAAGARRPLWIADPAAGRLSRDEFDLLLTLEAARAGLASDARWLLADLLGRQAIDTGELLCSRLADRLRECELTLLHGTPEAGTPAAGTPAAGTPEAGTRSPRR